MDAKKKDIIDVLREIHKSQRLVPVIGAGFSRPFSLPDWGELLISVAKKFSALDSTIDTARSIMNNQNYIQAVSTITAATKKSEVGIQEAVVEIIRKKKTDFLYNKNCENFAESDIDTNYSDLSNFNAILTLNYDEIIADYNKNHAGTTFQQYQDTHNFGQKKDIIYVHGRVSDASSIVLAKSNYDDAYKNESFKNKFAGITLGRTLLFMGFSFQDTYIKVFLETVTLGSGVTHYALMDKTSVTALGAEAVEDYKKKYNVEIIEYNDTKGDHILQIRDFLNLISTVQEVSKSNTERFKTWSYYNDEKLFVSFLGRHPTI